MEIYLASKNKNKIEEFNYLLKPHYIKSIEIEVNEVGLSFQENALLKARACAKEQDGIYMGDDSGIMITALGGEPGIHSKRWQGAKNNQEAITKVLKALCEKNKPYYAQMICFWQVGFYFSICVFLIVKNYLFLKNRLSISFC